MIYDDSCAVSYAITPKGVTQYRQLHCQAIETVMTRFYTAHGAEYARFGERGRKACREDIEFHLQFLTPVLELGLLQPYTDYLRWVGEVLASRNIPAAHIAETLGWLGEFFKHHLPGPDGETIARALATAAMESQKDALPAEDHEPNRACWPEQGPFEAALLKGDRQQAINIVGTLLQAGHALVEIEVLLIHPVLVSIGQQWQNNRISTANEHLATAIAQTVMAESFAKIVLPRLNRKKALFACIEGNTHAVGLRMISDAFELEGWEVQFLGANTPTHALVQQIGEWMPDLIGLSIAFAHQLSTAREV